MKPSEIITEVRRLIQDVRTPYRYTDAVLLGMVNQSIKRMVVVRPDLFSYIGEFPVQDGSLQIMPTDSVRFVEAFQIKDGDAIVEADRKMMDRTYPQWRIEARSTPLNFLRHPRNPNAFFLYPRPTVDIILIIEYIRVPELLGIDDTVGLPEVYFTPLVDCTVFLAESVDNEHANSGRAKLFFDSFMQSLSVALDSRNMTDADDAAVKKATP